MIEKMIESEATTMTIDGITLVNPREIAFEIAYELIEQDIIYEFDISNKITEYLADIYNEATNRAIELIEENNREIR